MPVDTVTTDPATDNETQLRRQWETVSDTFADTIPRSSADPIVTDDHLVRMIVEDGDDSTVVRITGELDLTGEEVVTRACADRQTRKVIVDLAGLTFLDCGGYRALVTSRRALEQHGRTLVLVGAVGEPRRFLDLVEPTEQPRPT